MNHTTKPVPGVEGSLARSDSPDNIIPSSLEKKIVSIEQQLDSLKNKPIDDLVDDLSGYAKGAMESASAALSAAHYAIVYAWATGCVLNLAKEILGRGSFGKWRDTKAEELSMSVRTAQNWMKLAKDCWDVRALLVPGASLTSAYRVTGVLPQADKVSQGQGDNGEDGDPSSSPRDTSQVTELAFTALGEGRKRLRHLVESARILEDEERDRLEEEKSAFVTLIDKLLNPIVP